MIQKSPRSAIFNMIIMLIPIFIGVGILWWYLQKTHIDEVSRKQFVEFVYKKELKNIFFTGFMTLGSFLFAMKSFTLVNLKKEIFDKASHKKDYIENITKYNADPNAYLKPFKNLSNLLFMAVLSSLLTSIAQVSLGMMDKFICAQICISLAAFTLAVVLFALYWLKKNIDVWVNCLEKDDYKEIIETPVSIDKKLIPKD